MKAWNITRLASPLQALEKAEKSLPSPASGELRIKVAAAALALPDVMMCRGDYEYKPPLPFTPGQEICGTVLECGTNTSHAVGDRVMGVSSFMFGNGGFADECMSIEGMVYPAPDFMSDVEASVFSIAYQTAWIALVSRGGIKVGESLVVLGAAGGCGSAAVQLGKALGARVIAVVGSKKKADFCARLGADETINYRDASFVDEVNRLTSNQGAQLIFDPVGGNTFERAIACLGNGGRLLSVGFASGRWGIADTHALLLRNASILGVFVGAYTAEERLAVHTDLVNLYQQGKIKPAIDEAVSFNDLPTALERLARSEVMGRIVMRP